jgi:putative membrane protein
MHFLIDLLLNAAVLFILSTLLPSVRIKNYGTAVWVALVIGLLNATTGFALRLPLNILTLGLISFIIRLFVSAIMIKLADFLFPGFKVSGWVPAFIIAICMAIAGTLLMHI